MQTDLLDGAVSPRPSLQQLISMCLTIEYDDLVVDETNDVRWDAILVLDHSRKLPHRRLVHRHEVGRLPSECLNSSSFPCDMDKTISRAVSRMVLSRLVIN